MTHGRAVCFANSKGGVGKTFLVVHAARALAKRGDVDVLVIDLSRFGDASAALLGGEANGGRSKTSSMATPNTSAGMLEGLRGADGAMGVAANFVRWVARTPSKVDLRSVGVRIDDNLRLLVGGEGLSALADDGWRSVADAVREAILTPTPSDAKPLFVVFDTDHEVGSAHGGIGLAVADAVMLVGGLNHADWSRAFATADSLSGVTRAMRRAECPCADVRAVIVNRVRPSSWTPNETSLRSKDQHMSFQASAGDMSLAREAVQGMVEAIEREGAGAASAVLAQAYPTVAPRIAAASTAMGKNIFEPIEGIATKDLEGPRSAAEALAQLAIECATQK